MHFIYQREQAKQKFWGIGGTPSWKDINFYLLGNVNQWEISRIKTLIAISDLLYEWRQISETIYWNIQGNIFAITMYFEEIGYYNFCSEVFKLLQNEHE